MKIVSLEAIAVRIPLKPECRMISALGRHEVSQFVVVKLTTDSGLVGAGEATVTPRWSGETVWGAQAIIQNLFAPLLVGFDLSDLSSLIARMDLTAADNWFAKSAIEMACWDVLGKAVGKPVFELLGGAVRSLTIRNRFSLGAYDPEVAAERAAQRIASGFTTIKVKVGTGPDLDIARVRAVRQAIGPDNHLTIDANGGWSNEQARFCLERIQDYRVELVEQPLQRGDYTLLKKLRQDFGIRVLADESCFEEIEVRELILHNCCDAITLYPGKQGGIAKARRMAEIAEQAGIPCTIGSNLEWDIGAAAMMHFVVSTSNVQIESIPGDCLGPSYHEFSIAKIPLQIAGAFTTLPTTPGLGIDVDWDVVERHRIR